VRNNLILEQREALFHILVLLKEQWVGVLQDNSKHIVILDPQTLELTSNLQDYESNGKKTPQ